MAYASWSVTFGEQPSASKWNILGTNDASFNDGTGIANMALSTTALSNPYKFRAYSNTTQNSGSGAFAKVLLNSENYDTNSNFASNDYTAPVAGFYLFGGRIHTTSTSSRLIVAIYKNSAEVARGSDLSATLAAGAGVSVTSVLQLAANDVINLQSFGSGTLTLAGGSEACYLYGILLCKT